MRMTKDWIKAGHEALRKAKIVDAYNRFPAPFKGYFSSFGASVAQSGLLAASLFFENAENDAEANRSLVVCAVVEVLHTMKVLSDEEYGERSLAMIIHKCHSSRLSQLLPLVDHAIATLKLSLRDFRGCENLKTDMPSFGYTIEDVYEPETMTSDEFEKKFPKSNAQGANLGWIYYRDYYRDMNIDPYPIKVSGEEKGLDQEIRFQRNNERLLSASLGHLGELNEKLLGDLRPDVCFDLTTQYPGLLIGSGLAHGTGMDYDLKMGVSFDYTTGLPYLAGSAVKGVLRSFFPLFNDEEENKRRIAYLQEKCPSVPNDQWKRIAMMLFSANDVKSGSVRSVFFDAMIIRSNNQGGKILGDDFITPHKSSTKNPIPLQFLKVLSGVTFRFAFRIGEPICLLSKAQIGDLFKSILLDVGIGAKTNVGYGQFVKG